MLEEIKNVILRQITLEKLLREYSFIIEGVDINKKGKLVSFNSKHENNVNTSIILNPTYSIIDGHPVISIFKRKQSKDNDYDGNPLIYALKGLYGWKFKNPKEDIIGLLKQFIRIAEKIKPVYDTIITIPSNNSLNEEFLYRLNKIIKSEFQIKDWLFKLDAQYVYDAFVDWKGMSIDYPEQYDEFERQLDWAFSEMEKNGNGEFSFKTIKVNLRKYITQTLDGYDDKTIIYAPYINGKDILVLDDTIASGQTISSACKVILETFTPKSITIITLFSKV